MNLKIKKKIPLIDQHDKSYMYGGKFGGNFIPETLKKPIDDLTNLFEKLRKDKKFHQKRDYYFKNYIVHHSFIKLENLTGVWVLIYAKWQTNGGFSKSIMLQFTV